MKIVPGFSDLINAT